jgi:GNAT superfamily N-acetyltransferase
VTDFETVEGFRIEVREPAELTIEDRRLIAAIFDAAYAQANHRYLDASIERIGRIAFAVGEDGTPAAYAIGRPRWMRLAGFREPQLVWLHGMRATDPSYRHRGLSGALSRALSVAARGEIGEPPARELGCGRFGHASRQGQMVEGNHVPWPGLVPTPWQQAVGLAVAEAYGSDLDPETFVCRGSGRPIGVPNVHFEATEQERAVFTPVQRERGDNLLVINWSPDPPPRWADPERPIEELA